MSPWLSCLCQSRKIEEGIWPHDEFYTKVWSLFTIHYSSILLFEMFHSSKRGLTNCCDLGDQSYTMNSKELLLRIQGQLSTVKEFGISLFLFFWLNMPQMLQIFSYILLNLEPHNSFRRVSGFSIPHRPLSFQQWS